MAGLPDRDPTDLARLRRELSTGAVTVAEDDSGIYLQADEFEVCADADEVRVAADPLVVLLNGMASLSFGGYRRVGLSGTIAREESNYLFMEDSFRLSDELSVVRVVADITTEGVVTTVDGTVPDSPGLSSMQRRLASIATYPELADVYRLLGRKDPAWDELYRVYELLSKAMGGEQMLPKRTGVAR